MGNFSCPWPQCSKSYNKQCHLQEHLMSHTDEKPFVCSEPGCYKSYRRSSHLKLHYGSVHDSHCQKRHSCHFPGCYSSFSILHNLRRHLKTHESEHPFQCSEKDCKAAFIKHHQLYKHMALEHGAPLPFACGNCSLRFLYPSQLRRHEATHSDTLKYVCGEPDCLEKFTKWPLLRKHMSLAHSKKSSPQRQPCHDNVSPTLSIGHAIACEEGDAKKEAGHPLIDTELVDGEMSLASSLSGLDYYQSRPIPCPHVDCHKRFKRQYDCRRHLQSEHGS